MHLGVIANFAKQHAGEVLLRVARLAADRGISLHADASTVAAMGAGEVSPDPDHLGRVADAVLVLGGDGSILHANRMLGGCGVPLAGINTGTLGYMTCAGADRLEEVIAGLQDGSVRIEDRRMLSADFHLQGKPPHPPKQALNDVVVSRGESGRVVSLGLSVDGHPVTTYVCDGLIVATPTGSTAYSMAAGGPILSTETPALVLSVICPHTLSSRPLVLPDTSEIEIAVRKAAAPLLVSVDGQDDAELCVGDRIRITRSPHVARIVLLHDHDPFAVLRRKLGWSGSTGG